MRPKARPFEFDSTSADRLFEVVPAETLMFVNELATLALAVIVEPFRPKETLLLLLSTNALRLLLVVPALRLMFVSELAMLAVTTELLLIPKVTPLLLLKTIVPLVPVCVPAAAAIPPPAAAATEAVKVEPFKPNETPLAFANVRALRLLLVVPPLMLTAVNDVATLPVIVDPLSPKLTPFELLNTSALRLFDVVPAETFTFVRELATLAVTTELLVMPKLTLFEFEKTTVPLDPVCVPAAIEGSRETLAVICVDPDIPNEIPFELLRTIVPEVAVCVPAAKAFVATASLLNASVPLALGTTTVTVPTGFPAIWIAPASF